MKCWHQAGHMGQWDRTENPESNFHIYAQLTFKQDTKATQEGKDTPNSSAYILG